VADTMNQASKRKYSRPKLEIYGQLTELTASGSGAVREDTNPGAPSSQPMRQRA
jgi:hypothetical protein